MSAAKVTDYSACSAGSVSVVTSLFASIEECKAEGIDLPLVAYKTALVAGMLHAVEEERYEDAAKLLGKSSEYSKTSYGLAFILDQRKCDEEEIHGLMTDAIIDIVSSMCNIQEKHKGQLQESADSQSASSTTDEEDKKVFWIALGELAKFMTALWQMDEEVEEFVRHKMIGFDDFAYLVISSIDRYARNPDELEERRNRIESDDAGPFWKILHILPLGVFVVSQASAVLSLHARDKGYVLDLQGILKTLESLKHPTFDEWVQIYKKHSEVSVPMGVRWSEVSSKLTMIENNATKKLCDDRKDDIQKVSDQIAQLVQVTTSVLKYRFEDNFGTLIDLLGNVEQLSGKSEAELEMTVVASKKEADEFFAIWSKFNLTSKIQLSKVFFTTASGNQVDE